MPDITTISQGGGNMGLLGGLLGGAQMADGAPAGGLLGNGWNDPKSQANMALFANMINGNFGAGVDAYGRIMGPEGQLQRAKLAEAQLNQAMQAYQLKRLQAWDQMVNGDGSQGAAPAQSAAPQSLLPPGSITSPGAFFPSADGMGPVAPPSQLPQAVPQDASSQGQGGQPARWQYGLRGMSDQTSRAIAASMNPADYMKLLATQNAPQTDIEKLLASQGISASSPIGQQFIAQAIKKANNIPLQSGRAGAPMFDSDGNVIAMAPKIPDNAIPQVVNGRVVGVTPLPGGAEMTQINSFATNAGKAQTTPVTAYRPGSMQPTFTNAFEASQGGLSPQAAPAGSATPQGTDAGAAQRAAGDVAALQREIALANRSMDPPAVKQQRLDILNAELAKANAAAGGALSPALAPGVAESQGKLASAGADRYNATVAQAAESPMRVNVYDNILNLSKQGVATGPGEAWKNQVKGYAANTPFLSSITGNWKDDVSGFQELNKFMYQNAQRNWQAAGGTGTDAQLEAYSHANPNDTMFPKALQAMAEWGKAGELALQGKANALQSWKDQNGGNVANQDQFERTWRNSFDPVLFQLKTMDPAQASVYVANLKSTNPKGYNALMAKATALKDIGGL